MLKLKAEGRGRRSRCDQDWPLDEIAGLVRGGKSDFREDHRTFAEVGSSFADKRIGFGGSENSSSRSRETVVAPERSSLCLLGA